MRKRTLVIPKKPIILFPINYTSFSDAFLNTPNADLDQDNNFIPASEAGGTPPSIRAAYGVGQEEEPWGASDDTVGTGKTLIGYGSGQTVLNWIYFASDGFNTYAANTYDGLQRFWFAKFENNDMAGGFIEYYFSNSAWSFSGGSFQFAQNGSVYVLGGVGDNTQLIVRWDGTAGQAGGGALIDDTNRIIY